MATTMLPQTTVREGLVARSRRPSGGWKQLAVNQAFLLPAILVLVFLFVVPLAQSFYWSLTDFTGYSLETNFVGLSNYRTILTDPSMLAALGFTLLFAVGTTVLVTLIAIPLAVQLNKRFFGRNFVRSLWFFPAIPSMAILGLVWRYIMSPLESGVVNSVLQDLFGIGPFGWLSDGTLARISVIMVGIWAAAGWHAVLYMAYLQSIPNEYYEVARIDGASARQQFFGITLPLLSPALVISTFLLMTAGLKVFDLPYTLTNGGPGFSTYTITQSIVVAGVSQGRYGLASALAVMFTVAVAALAFGQLALTKMIERRFV
ncbi:carbohydrate ABC transporter permease [Isoptericola variabilis]|uniref:ABC-type transporter, integral membrane subunit n=1 Tax=Isoptericola variabilis (strain 225) TaxID=743718 RepID=F6FR73_ISOV2|nr:sugar ABC transporter permease [Isoptericola variabilis]AEG42933.1 ABC-type transporter, integral membrane subunit [Isoptericola variabilis 225]TWH31817.1 multiple sugar transport system permease protein/raffinose/stachyose/melibiose transport system permease protein [Isoptericola variabilis J7]